MYREWLAKMLESAPRGTKARLAEHLSLSGDVVSKMLSGVRDITADELRQISNFFEKMPPGFEMTSGGTEIIQGDAEILAALDRIDGLGPRGVELAMMTIKTAIAANSPPRSEQPFADDRSVSATARRESQSSPQRS